MIIERTLYDEVIVRANAQAMLAAAYLVGGEMTKAHHCALVALDLEREASRVGTPRGRDFEDHVTSGVDPW